MTETMTKKEMAEMIETLTLKNENLIKNQNSTVKGRIVEMIESGINCIEDLASTLEITSKNVSSNLTAIRKDLVKDGKTIITQRIEKRTMLAVVSFKDMKW